jgi:hypothetical protein
MTPTMYTKQLRGSACRADLRDNGIDLEQLDPGVAREFIRQNLDYFQLMLGYDAREREVYALVGIPPGRPVIPHGHERQQRPVRGPRV